MSAKSKTHEQPVQDARPDAIGQVWGTAIGMLAVCIPLCVLLKSGAIPIIVIVGAVLVSMHIWQTESRQTADADEEAEALRTRIAELEERLANVEVINSFEERLAERTIARQQEEIAAREQQQSA